jgi:hypothetical protein
MPPDSVLDRLARAGLAILTPPEQASADALRAVIESVPAPLRVALVETPEADVPKFLDARGIPWRRVSSEWDDVPGWFAERKK